jgi:hypothetical protein
VVACNFFFALEMFSQAGGFGACEKEEAASKNDFYWRIRRPPIKIIYFRMPSSACGTLGHLE